MSEEAAEEAQLLSEQERLDRAPAPREAKRAGAEWAEAEAEKEEEAAPGTGVTRLVTYVLGRMRQQRRRA